MVYSQQALIRMNDTGSVDYECCVCASGLSSKVGKPKISAAMLRATVHKTLRICSRHNLLSIFNEGWCEGRASVAVQLHQP